MFYFGSRKSPQRQHKQSPIFRALQSLEERLTPVGDIALSNSIIVENNVIGSPVGTLSTIDSTTSENIEYRLVNGTGDDDNGRFSISSDTLLTQEVFNYEKTNFFSIRVQAHSTSGVLSETVLQLRVVDINDPPANGLAGSFTGIERTQLKLEGISVTDEDAGNDNIKVTFTIPLGSGYLFMADDVAGGLTGRDIRGVNTNQITLNAPINRINTTLQASSAFTFFPSTDFAGNFDLTMISNDQGDSKPGGAQSTASVADIHILSINSPPTISPISNPPAIDEDSPEQIIPISGISPGSKPSESNQRLKIKAVSDNPSLIDDIQIIGDGSDREIRFTPNANANGLARITLTIQDDGGTDNNGIDTTTTLFEVIVNAVNDPPSMHDDTFVYSSQIATGVTLGTLNAVDPDQSDSIAFQIDSGNSDGALYLDPKTGDLRVADAARMLAVGNRNVIVRATDQHQLFATASISIHLDSAPKINGAGLADVVKQEDDQPFEISLKDLFRDDGPFSISIGENTNPELCDLSLIDDSLSIATKPDEFGTTIITISATDRQNQRTDEVFTLTILPVNDRPILDITPVIIGEIIANNSISQMGFPVTRLTHDIQDRDPNSRRGIAIVSADQGSKNGTWEYSTDNGTTWKPFGSVDETRAFLLADLPENRLRFKPKTNFNGFANLDFKAWDQSTGVAETFADSTIGTAYSVEIERTTSVIGKTIPTIDLEGIPQLTPIASNQATIVGDEVRYLLGVLANDPESKSLGIAVTSVDNHNGQWQYWNAKCWNNIADATDSSAVLLSPSTKIRFIPNPDFAGNARIGYRAWDQSLGRVGNRANSNDGQFSTQSLIASIQVIKRPKLDTSLAQSLLNTSTSITVDDLLKNAVTKAQPADLIGIAITGTSGKGFWTYQIGSDPAVKIVGTPSGALLLPGNAILHFTPAKGYVGKATLLYRAWNRSTLQASIASTENPKGLAFSEATETLSVYVTGDAANNRPVLHNQRQLMVALNEDTTSNLGKLVSTITKAAGITDADKFNNLGIALTSIDQTNGTWSYSLDRKTWNRIDSVSITHACLLPSFALLRFEPNAHYFGSANCSFVGWDGTFASPGDFVNDLNGNSFSLDFGEGTWLINGVNDKPTLDTSWAILSPAIKEGGTTDFIKVGDLIPTVEDIDTSIDSIGVCITAATGPGRWVVSTDGTTTNAMPAFPALLPRTAMLRFIADPQKIGIAMLTFQAWDGTVAQTGKATKDSLSAARGFLKIAVGNTPPVLLGAGKLTAINENTSNPHGDTVGAILGTTVLDGSGNKKGLAVTGSTQPIQGNWQFSVDQGKTWRLIGKRDETDALLLPESARVRFLPAKDVFTIPGFEPWLTYKAWDQTVGMAGQRVDTTTNLSNAFSGTATVLLNVRPIPHVPILNTNQIISLNNPTTISDLLRDIATIQGGSELGISTVSMTGPGTWQVDQGHGFVDIKSLPKTSQRFASNSVLRFIPKPGFIGKATLRFKAWTSKAGVNNLSTETGEIAMLIGNQRPVILGL